MNPLKFVNIYVIMLLVLPAQAALTTSVEVRGTIANQTSITGGFNLSNTTTGAFDSPVWTPFSFSGFFYDTKNNLGIETLKILGLKDRTIPKDKLVYTTQGQVATLDVVEYIYKGNATEAIRNGLENFDSGQMGPEKGRYNIIGWMGKDYAVIKNKSNKLAKIVINQDSNEKKTMTAGQTWEMGGGWKLTAESVDARTTPRQALLVLSKNGVRKDIKIIEPHKIYTFIENSLGGESDVPVFVTYVDNVFAGRSGDMVQLSYSWAIDTSIAEIKIGDRYGIFEVKGTEQVIQLRNYLPVTLDKGSIIDLLGETKFRVADSDDLRLYPLVEYKIPVTEAAASMAGGNVSNPETQNGLAAETNSSADANLANASKVQSEPKNNEPVQSTVPAPDYKGPGFESLLTIAGFLAVIYLIKIRKI